MRRLFDTKTVTDLLLKRERVERKKRKNSVAKKRKIGNRFSGCRPVSKSDYMVDYYLKALIFPHSTALSGSWLQTGKQT